MQPGAAEPLGQSAFAAVGLVKTTTGAMPAVTVHGMGCMAVLLPAVSVATAATSFWPWLNITKGNVAMPLENVGIGGVWVEPLFVIVSATSGVSVEKMTSVSNVANAWWKLPQKFAGVVSEIVG